jgi:hypothetical protein
VTKKDEAMDRERFLHLLEAYGGDFRRWPAETRALAAAYAAQDADAASALAEARALDRALDAARHGAEPSAALAARILAQAPRAAAFDRRALFALAACAVFGVVIGYGGGLLAPPPAEDEYFAVAFEAPLAFEDEEG